MFYVHHLTFPTPVTSGSTDSGHLFCFVFLIEVELIYNVMLVSSVKRSDSVIHTYIYILFQILFPYRLLQNIECSSLCYTVDPCWLSVLYRVACIC